MNENFNDPNDKDYIKKQLELDSKSEIVPVDFEVVSEKSNYLTEVKDPDSMVESISNITDTYKSFGEKYGIDIKYNVDSVSSTFKSILTDDAEAVFKVYIAKSFSKTRLAVFQKVLVSITTLVDRVTQKEILESENIELSVGLIEKLLFLMEKVNSIYKEVEIESSDLVLSNLSKEIKQKESKESGSEMDSLDPMTILRLLKQDKPTEE